MNEASENSTKQLLNKPGWCVTQGKKSFLEKNALVYFAVCLKFYLIIIEYSL